MLKGVSATTLVRDEIATAANKHYALIGEYSQVLRKSVAFSTNMLAAFCRASLYFGKQHVMPLAERFASEMWASTTDPLKTLHTRLVKTKLAQTPNERRAALTKDEKYGVTVSALRAALADEPRTKIEGTTQDVGEAEVDERIRSKFRAGDDESSAA